MNEALVEDVLEHNQAPYNDDERNQDLEQLAIERIQIILECFVDSIVHKLLQIADFLVIAQYVG